jgi:Zinc knuckle
MPDDDPTVSGGGVVNSDQNESTIEKSAEAAVVNDGMKVTGQETTKIGEPTKVILSEKTSASEPTEPMDDGSQRKRGRDRQLSGGAEDDEGEQKRGRGGAADGHSNWENDLEIDEDRRGPRPPPPDTGNEWRGLSVFISRDGSGQDIGLQIGPQRLRKALHELSGAPVIALRPATKGWLRATVGTEAHVQRLVAIKRVLDIPVVVERPRPRIRAVRGVVSRVPDELDTEERVLAELSEQNVKEARKMGRGVYCLTFTTDVIPSTVVLWYGHGVREYEEGPRQCHRCLRYYHTSGYCRGEQRCRRCGQTGHIQKDCAATEPKCVNCGERHVAGVSYCRASKTALEAQRVSQRNGVPMGEARKEVERRHREEADAVDARRRWETPREPSRIEIGNGRQAWQHAPAAPLETHNRFEVNDGFVTPEGSAMEDEEGDRDDPREGWRTTKRRQHRRSREGGPSSERRRSETETSQRMGNPIPVVITTETKAGKARGSPGKGGREDRVEGGQQEKLVCADKLPAAGDSSSRHSQSATGSSSYRVEGGQQQKLVGAGPWPAAGDSSSRHSQPATSSSSSMQQREIRQARRQTQDGPPGYDPVRQQRQHEGTTGGGSRQQEERSRQQKDMNEMTVSDLFRQINQRFDELFAKMERILSLFMRAVGMGDILQGGSGGVQYSGGKCMAR